MNKLILFIASFLIIGSMKASHVIKREPKFKKARKSLYVTLTEGVAFRLGYFDEVRALRNKASNFIDSLRRTLRIKIGDLLFDRRLHQVEVRSRQYLKFVNFYEAAFDDLFEEFEDDKLKKGIILDIQNATVDEKEDFIMDAKKKLKEGVNKIIEDARRKLPRQLNI